MAEDRHHTECDFPYFVDQRVADLLDDADKLAREHGASHEDALVRAAAAAALDVLVASCSNATEGGEMSCAYEADGACPLAEQLRTALDAAPLPLQQRLSPQPAPEITTVDITGGSL